MTDGNKNTIPLIYLYTKHPLAVMTFYTSFGNMHYALVGLGGKITTTRIDDKQRPEAKCNDRLTMKLIQFQIGKYQITDWLI